jgi:hypothetical protein
MRIKIPSGYQTMIYVARIRMELEDEYSYERK